MSAAELWTTVVVLVVRVVVACALSWFGLQLVFPLAFESYADGVQLTLLGAILVRLSVMRARPRS